jgi:hypothetical protein
MTSTDHGGPAARERIGEQVDPYGHGHSPAAWAAVFVVMLGALIASVAVVVGELWLGIVRCRGRPRRRPRQAPRRHGLRGEGPLGRVVE